MADIVTALVVQVDGWLAELGVPPVDVVAEEGEREHYRHLDVGCRDEEG